MLTVSGGSGSGYQYRLSNPGSFSALPTNPYTVSVTAGNFYYVFVQDDSGNHIIIPIGVSIAQTVSAPTVSGTAGCPGNSTLSASCTNGTLLWSTGETTDIIIVPTTAAVYSVSCLYQNCTSEGSSLTVNPAASFTVTSTADSGPNTLRQAILDMNALIACEPFLITIDAPGPVSLTAALPELRKSVTITSVNALTPATATGGSTIERATGSADFRLLLARTTGKTLTLRNLILQRGVGIAGLGGFRGGGAVVTDNGVALTMERCLVQSCSAVAQYDGAGIQAVNGPLTLTDCEFRDNQTGNNGYGGAIRTGLISSGNPSSTRIERCTFLRNGTDKGGAVYLNSPTELINCTFDGNQSSSTDEGAAIFAQGGISVSVVQCTFRNHTSGTVVIRASGSLLMVLTNNLFAQNSIPHFSGLYTSLGGNVSDKPEATTLNQATDRVGQPVSLSAAAANGGLAQTCELSGACSNPAIDAGVATTLTADARGVAYVGAPDAGAYENGTGAVSSVTVVNPATQTATIGVSFAGAFSATGGASPYSFTMVSGTLPNGLTLSTAGSLSGIPTQTGTFTVVVRGTDANGCVALSNVYSLTIGLGCQPILHVTESGSGLQDGSSWANSLPGTALQTAIDQAASCGGGEVWVARGTYKPTTATGPDSRTVSFAMRNNVQIYGGFDGLPSETTLGSRPVQNPRLSQFSSTTLSGDIGTVGNTADNSYHVISNPTGLTTGTHTALLDGVVITGGNANGTSSYNSGGGLYNDRSSPALQNCLFMHNSAEFGGGIFTFNSGTPVLTNCAFLYNTARNGGGMIATPSASQPILTGCRFEYNSATNQGGGIYSSGTPTLTDCLFQYNTASSGGGAIVSNTNAFSLTRCVFRYNTTNGSGGAIYFNDFGGVLTHCVFQSNTAVNGAAFITQAVRQRYLTARFSKT